MAEQPADLKEWIGAFGAVVQGRAGPELLDRLSELGASNGLLYRELVFRSIRQGIQLQLPNTCRLLGSSLDGHVSEYVATALFSSHYLRDTASAFASFLKRTDATLCCKEVARYEALGFEVLCARASHDVAPAEVALDSPISLHPTVRIASFAVPVHALNVESHSPSEEETFLLLYRDEDFELRQLALTKMAYELLTALLRGASLGEAVTLAANRCAVELCSDVLCQIGDLVEDLRVRGVWR